MIPSSRGLPGPGPWRVLDGLWRLARGQAAGFERFGGTAADFLSSLAPLLAFPLVGGLLLVFGGRGLGAVTDTLTTICALLAPPVLSHGFAVVWGREAAWGRYATAFNWCQWIVPLALAAALTGGSVLGTVLGLPHNVAAGAALAVVLGYGLWLHWFLARHGLELGAARAAILVAGVNLGTVLLIVAPRLAALAAGQAVE